MNGCRRRMTEEGKRRGLGGGAEGGWGWLRQPLCIIPASPTYLILIFSSLSCWFSFFLSSTAFSPPCSHRSSLILFSLSVSQIFGNFPNFFHLLLFLFISVFLQYLNYFLRPFLFFSFSFLFFHVYHFCFYFPGYFISCFYLILFFFLIYSRSLFHFYVIQPFIFFFTRQIIHAIQLWPFTYLTDTNSPPLL